MVKILCEGKGDQQFLSRFLTHLEIDHSNDNFQIMRSKTFFFDESHVNYRTLQPAIDTGEISALLFIIDADNNTADTKHGGYENSLSSIKTIIAEKSWEEISTFFIACDPVDKTGCLESLIYSTLPKEQKTCIDDFIRCSDAKFGSGCKHKPILFHIFRSVWGDPRKIDTFDHAHFAKLKESLQKLFAEEL